MCWEAIRAQGGVVEGGVDGVFEASEEFGVRWVAQCGGQLLDGCGVVVLLVSIRVRRVLGHQLGGLFRRGYRGQVLQVAVVWGVQSHAFEPWGVVGVLVFFETSQISQCGASDTIIQSQKLMYKVMDSHNPRAPKAPSGVMSERRR